MIAAAGLATALLAGCTAGQAGEPPAPGAAGPLGGRVLVDAASGAAIPVTVAAAPAAGPVATGKPPQAGLAG